MENTEEKRTCYFCGEKELYFEGAFTLDGQNVYYWACEDCLNGILNETVINSMMAGVEGATLH